MGGFGKYALEVKFLNALLLNAACLFLVRILVLLLSKVPLGTGRYCSAGKRETLCCFGERGKLALTPNALPVILLHSGLQQRVGLCKPFLKSLQENTADSPNLTSEN